MTTPHHPSDHNPDNHDQAVLALCRCIRLHRRGVLVADGSIFQVRFVFDGRDGSIVMPVDRQAAQADQLVLWIPEDSFDAAQLLLCAQAEPDEQARDRYLAYHGQPKATAWLGLGIECARQGDAVVDGSEVTAPNSLARDEFAMCKALNLRLDQVQAVCARRRGVQVVDPRVVGVNQHGIDVRARFGIVRLELDQEATTADQVIAAFDRMATDCTP